MSAIRITEGSTPRKVATCFQSAATSRTMNLLTSSSVGCESMLKWVGVSVGVSVEGQDQSRWHQPRGVVVGVGNH